MFFVIVLQFGWHVLEHGRGKVLETLVEIQDRHDAAKEIEERFGVAGGAYGRYQSVINAAQYVTTSGCEQKESSESFTKDNFPTEGEYSVPVDEAEKLNSCKSSSGKTPTSSSLADKRKESTGKQVVREDASSLRICSVFLHFPMNFPDSTYSAGRR
ncbi:hypothetical protein Vadar_010078 [Vaccinium darrowii]|uniref:Uncharacterized protein n=1 Tax=Vaccinium darrowii TaxID=229202 RepID=A0ACB7XYP4_9ERIC|nr:hypothetical protein Vadar_010078 [Vaccinium darrowii]